jgi:hypothetical protein
MSLSNSKKGVIRDTMAVLVFLFIFGFVNILGYVILDSFNTEFSGTDYYYSEVEYVGNQFLGGLRILDWVIVVILGLMIIGIGISSFKVASSPVFFILTFIIAPALGFVGFFFNHLFAQLVSDSTFTAALVFFPNTLLICTNLHWIALTCIIVGSLTLYAKKQQGQFV